MKYDDLPEVHSIHCCSGESEIGMDGYLTAYEEEFDEESGRSYRTEKAHMSLQSFQCERLALIFEELGKRLKVGEDIAKKPLQRGCVLPMKIVPDVPNRFPKPEKIILHRHLFLDNTSTKLLIPFQYHAAVVLIELHAVAFAVCFLAGY